MIYRRLNGDANNLNNTWKIKELFVHLVSDGDLYRFYDPENPNHTLITSMKNMEELHGVSDIKETD